MLQFIDLFALACCVNQRAGKITESGQCIGTRWEQERSNLYPGNAKCKTAQVCCYMLVSLLVLGRLGWIVSSRYPRLHREFEVNLGYVRPLVLVSFD